MAKSGNGGSSTGSNLGAGTGTGAARSGAKPGINITKGAPKKKDRNARSRLLAVALNSGISFWHDADNDAFATVPRGKRIERYRVKSVGFKHFLRLLYAAAYEDEVASKIAGRRVPGSVTDSTMREMLPTLEALAQEGVARNPAYRVHQDDDWAIWIDLGDETWRLIKVDQSSWNIVAAADVPLIRSNGMRALPTPVRDPDALATLRGLLNLTPREGASDAVIALADTSFKLIAAFMLVVLWPGGPYPILSVNGEHGSAKSTGSKIVRMCTDPNKVPLRSVPRNPDDIFVTANNNRLVPLDNVSHLTAELSDVLCGIATGSGKGARRLYTDSDEVIIGACNPIMINGIEGVLTRADLADRCLSVMLPEIRDQDRRDEVEMEAAIAAAVPGVLALLLDAMVLTLQTLPTLKLPRMPRMADFTRLACAAAPAFGWTADDMLTAIEANRTITVEAVIAADVVATAVLAFLQKCEVEARGTGRTYLWIGSATELLRLLKDFVADDTARSKAWPKVANHLSGRLKRIAPALRNHGFQIIAGKDAAKNRKIAFKLMSTSEDKDVSSSPSSPSSPGNLFNELVGDDGFASSSPPSSPDGPQNVTGTIKGTMDDAASSPEESDYVIDNADEYHYGDDGDDRGDEMPLSSDVDYENLAPVSDLRATLGDDEEGEL